MIDKEEGTVTLESNRPGTAVQAPQADERTEGAAQSIDNVSDQITHYAEPDALGTTRLKTDWRSTLTGRLAEVNKELWLILSLLIIAGVMNYLVTAKRMILGFYTMPTLFSAYFYGRRHAVLTAFASASLVGLLVHLNPRMAS